MTKVPSLSLFGSGQLFDLTAPDLCVPGIPEGVLQQVISSEHGQCVMAASSPHRFFAALRVEAPFFFRGFPFSDGFYKLRSL